MAIKIDFDAAHNPQVPTIILAKKNGDMLGGLDASEVEITDSMNDESEMTFKVYKYVNGIKNGLWDDVLNFRLVYCVEWNQWFEITVEVDESNETTKTVTCTNLGAAELSQIMLYDIEINTEDDIARDDYKIPTVLYNQDHPEASLLNRITEKACHYTIGHIDSTIANIQRTFSFDGKSIYDAFQDISEEIDCLFVISASSKNAGDTTGSSFNTNINRTISVYDLESNCMECGYRGEFTGTCPKCGSSNIDEGYGEDTTIFVTADEIADSLSLTTDTDSIKNCFKLEAGDDLMTATIRNCNPNGSDYIWYISDDVKRDMSDELRSAIEDYDKDYKNYQNNHTYLSDKSEIITKYNDLIDKYSGYNEDLQRIQTPVNGYSSLMNAYYNTIDLDLYLTSGLMPTVKIDKSTAEKEAAKLTASNISPVAVESIDNISLATANSVVLSMAKVVADSTRFKIKVHDGAALSGEKPSTTRTWTGCFDVTNYSDEDDVATSAQITVEINNDYATFIKQKIDKTLAKDDEDNKTVISQLFDIDMSLDDFKSELNKHCLNRLTSFHDACQSCIDILVEQGVSDGQSWSKDMYDKLYTPYLQRLNAIEAEMKLRQDEIYIVSGQYDESGDLSEYGLQSYIVQEKNNTQDAFNFKNYLVGKASGGDSLWIEFCSFRREDKYSNDNYVSDGLDNAQLFKKANEFIETATNEIYKSAELQHSISADLKNLLVMKKFSPLVDKFQIGNWLRVMIDDELYKLRLIEYTISYDDISSISVEFSDVVRANSTIKSVKDVIDQASSIATSYGYVQRQAKQGEKSNSVVSNWVSNGLSVTNTKIVGGSDNQTQTWDDHGMLFRKYDEAAGDYEPSQMKIINSTLAITDDNWKTTKTAVGKYYYTDPITNELKSAYGVNAETIIGKLLLGENIELQNEAGTLVFNDEGLKVSHGSNTVTISPMYPEVINITNGEDSVFKVEENGELTINGNIMARSLSLANGVTIDSDVVTNLATVAVSGSYNDLSDKPSLKTVATSGSYNDLSDKPALKTVATSGNYNDLSNKPSLKTVATSGKYTDLSGEKSEAGKLLYIDTDGSVTTLTIAELKTLLNE